MPLPESQPLEVWYGEETPVTLVMDKNGSIAGQSFRLRILNSAGQILETKSTADAGIVISVVGSGSTPGQLTFTLAPDTDGVPVGEHEWWLRRTDAGSRRVVARGPLIVKEGEDEGAPPAPDPAASVGRLLKEAGGDSKVSELEAATTPADADLMVLVQGGVSKNITTSKVLYDKGRSVVNAAHPDFGGLSQSASADNSAALNAASLFCRQNGHKLKLPPGCYRIASPVFLTDTAFQTFEVEGAGRGFIADHPQNAITGRTVIWADFGDRPAFIINFGRGVRVAGISFVGNNVAPASIVHPSDVQAGYITAGCRTDRYSPYCAIGVDATVGSTPPGGGYPGLSYTAGGGSWDVTIERCTVSKFVVGVMLSPSSTSSQGDQVKLLDCRFDFCDVAIAWGQTQSRVNSVDRCDFFNSRRALDGVTYGQLTGCPPISVERCQYGALFEVFRFAATLGPLTFKGCRSESVNMLGGWGASVTTLRFPLTSIGCEWRIPPLGGATQNPSPWVLESYGPTTFVGGAFAKDGAGWHGAFNFVGHGGDLTFQGVTFWDGHSTNHPLIAYAPDNTSQNVPRFINCLAVRSDTYYYFGEVNRHLLLPARVDGQWAPERRSDFEKDYVFRHATAGTYFGPPPTISSVTWSSTQVSFTVPDPLIFQVGDLLFNLMNIVGGVGQAQYTPSLVVASVVGSTVTCDLMFPRARYDESGTTAYLVRRDWAPGTALTATTSSGSPTLTSVSPTTILKNGDWVQGTGIPANTRVVSGGGTATVTLSRNATANGSGVTLYDGRLHSITTSAAF